MLWRVACVLALVAVFAEAQRPTVEVEISTGIVQGRTIETHYNKSVNSFYGIPFAQPPVGDLRFREPLPAEPWDGVFEAEGLPTSCVQGIGGFTWLTHPGYRDHDEDCLTLNVFTPENMDPEQSYPVMVWFYGGGFTSGTTIQYPGHFLATRDVIIVASNYRVGIFGFASTDDDAARGNWGLHDQRLALEWVQENIEAFGGDPNSVTLFGQSAGGASTSHHIVSPGSRGLFHKVIAQSGTDMNFWSFNYPDSQPENYTKAVAANVDCPTEDNFEMMECLRGVEQWHLRNNSGFPCSPGHFCQGHAPVVDGVFFPDYPQFLRERGEFATDVQVMSGYLSDDGSFYTFIFIPGAREGGFNRTEFQRLLRENLIGIWADQFDEKTEEDAYQAMDFQYTTWPYLEDKALNRDAFNQMITDTAFGYVTDKQLLSHSKYRGGHYKYNFGYRSNGTLIDEGFWNNTEWAGVPHCGELPYVFGWALMKLSPQVRVDSRILIDIFEYNEEDFAVADFTMDLWTNFAKFGNPTPEPVEAPIGRYPVQMEEFTPDAFNMLKLTRDAEIVQDYRIKYNAFFTEYISYITGVDILSNSEKPGPHMSSKKHLKSSNIADAESRMVEYFLATTYPELHAELYRDY